MSLKRALLWCGVIGPIFFMVAYLVEGATRAGYDPMRDPVSSLALGRRHDLFSLGVFSACRWPASWRPSASTGRGAPAGWSIAS